MAVEMMGIIGWCAPFVVLFSISLHRASKKKKKPWLWYVVGIVIGVLGFVGARTEDMLNYGTMSQESIIRFTLIIIIALVFGLLIKRATKKG